MKKYAAIMMMLVILGACGTVMYPIAIDGSKADGTILMGVTVGPFDEVDWKGKLEEVVARCKSWGYEGAEGFEGVRERCLRQGAYSCERAELTRRYQCLN